MLEFPEGFVWGTATASYQIEGAVNEDGRGRSIWDTFSHEAGMVLHGDTGDIACDHYHRFAEDAVIMGSLGLNGYRLSIAWPRIQPEGAGRANQAGLDFYRRVVDAVLEQGIAPAITLYHWDLPQALQDRGGWQNRDTAARFVEYAELIAGALGDRVRLWITLNEPWVSAFVGHELGQHAPGVRDTGAALQAAHHLMLAHGLAVPALRAALPAEAQVGITLNLGPVHAATTAPEDAAVADLVDAYANRWFLDPILKGAYPERLHDINRTHLGPEVVRDGDLKVISAPIDFLGVNYYTCRHVGAAEDNTQLATVGSEVEASSAARRPYPPYLGAVEIPEPGVARTTKGWAIEPDGLRELLVRLHDDYGPLPLYVTENGAAFYDYATPEGAVNDPARIDYLHRHFAAAHAAIQAGVDLRGYFVWSLLDNFEWADGYSQRFGLIFVDYLTQARIPKASAAFVAAVAQDNAVSAL
jgi:beta-glucosidase